MLADSPRDTTTRTMPDDALASRVDGSRPRSVFAAGEMINSRFRILRFLGQGGMGQVFAAEDLELGATVALKVIRPEISRRPRSVERFKREVHLARQVTHPNVCRIFDLFEAKSSLQGWGQDGPPLMFITMEMVEGETLAERLRQVKRFSPKQALPLIREMAAALDAAHSAGILHLDFKSSNVMLADTPTGPRVVVTDFGLAQGRHDAGTGPHLDGTGFSGTPAYASPEMVVGDDPTPAADLYSLGVVIYEMLTGMLPFRTPSARATALLRLEQDPPSPRTWRPELDRTWDQAVMRCLERCPQQRFANAAMLIEALTGETRPASRPQPWHRRPAAAVALVLGVGSALLVTLLNPLFQTLENRWLDLRIYLAPLQSPRHPLLLVLIDEPTIESLPTALMDLADDLGSQLTTALASGAAGVGIDLLLPAAWSHSEPFSNLVLRHPEKLALAAFSPPGKDVIGTRAVDGLTTAALGPKRTQDLFGFVNLDQERDGLIRRAQTHHHDVQGELRSSFAARMVQILQSNRPEMLNEHPFWIDFTVDWQQLEQISWRDFAPILATDPERVRNRLVLVGSTYIGTGDGRHRVPHPHSLPGEIPGTIIQALTIHTLLDGAPLKELTRSWLMVATAALASLAAAAQLLARPAWASAILIVGWSLASYLMFLSNMTLLPVASVGSAILLATTVAHLLHRRPRKER